MHEQHLGALALDDDVELDIVDPHPVAVDCHVAFGRDQITALIQRLTDGSVEAIPSKQPNEQLQRSRSLTRKR
jgi:hypothetical protein